jgi:hypothetical protein
VGKAATRINNGASRIAAKPAIHQFENTAAIASA